MNHERAWWGLVGAALFFAGLVSEHLYPGAGTKTTAVTHDEATVKQTARLDEQRTADVVATAQDTGTEHIERTSQRAPDGAVETKTIITRAFTLRRAQREQEHEEAHAETKTEVRVVHDTKIVTEVRERQADWSFAVLGGVDSGITPIVSAQVGRRILGPFEAIVQVQAAPRDLGRWAVFAGVGARW